MNFIIFGVFVCIDSGKSIPSDGASGIIFIFIEERADGIACHEFSGGFITIDRCDIRVSSVVFKSRDALFGSVVKVCTDGAIIITVRWKLNHGGFGFIVGVYDESPTGEEYNGTNDDKYF